MKKTTLIIFFSLFCLFHAATAQVKDSTKKDTSTKLEPVPDTVPLITNKQFMELYDVMRKSMSIEQLNLFNLLDQKMATIYNDAAEAYRRKNKKLK